MGKKYKRREASPFSLNIQIFGRGVMNNLINYSEEIRIIFFYTIEKSKYISEN